MQNQAIIQPEALSGSDLKKLGYVVSAWILTFPFGVAIHNLVDALSLIVIGILIVKNKKLALKNLSELPRPLYFAWGFFVLYIASNVAAGLLNTEINNHLSTYIAGRLAITILPFAIFALGPKKILEHTYQTNKKLFISVLGVWTAVLVSQYFWPWGVRGTEIVHYGHRPEGFYSNALTLAYAIFLILPAITVNFFKKLDLYWGLCFAFIVTALFVNSSRTVIAVSALLVAYNIFMHLKGKMKILAVVVCLVGTTLVFTTKNNISSRVNHLLEQGDQVTFKGYPDHRLVFWHAFYHMIKEKPIFGHGPKLSKEYYRPYYEKLGLGEFEKIYNAHNQFIQIAGTSGLVGLTCFLLWAVFFCKAVITHTHCKDTKTILLQTFIGFMIAGLTQNAFQDSEVRHGIMLLSLFAFSAMGHDKKSDESELS